MPTTFLDALLNYMSEMKRSSTFLLGPATQEEPDVTIICLFTTLLDDM